MGSWILENFPKKAVQNFSIKLGRVGKIGGLFYLVTVALSKFIFLSCVVCVCVLLIYTISISILCVSQEGFRLVESNQQIYNFYKWVILKRKNIVDLSSVFSTWKALRVLQKARIKIVARAIYNYLFFFSYTYPQFPQKMSSR